MDEDSDRMGRGRGKPLALALVALALVAAGVLAATTRDDPRREPGEPSRAPAAQGAVPNLLVVTVDDQSFSQFDRKAMPRTLELFADGGTRFDQAIAAPPLCCPSRAGFITGRYPHNHGVVENTIGYRSMAGKERTFPVALQAAGYRTGMIGKFLNGYEPFGGPKPAPGFDRWLSIFGYAGYTDFQVSDDGRLRTEDGYATDALTTAAIDFTTRAREEPFFLWLSYNAPHTVQPGSPPPCDGTDAQPPSAAAYERFAGEALPRPPSFNERDVSDKPSYREGPDRLRPAEIDELTQTWRCARAALAGVDRQLARLTGALRDAGELERTVIVYASDNGLYFGEHRIAADKRLALEPALRVPMAIRVGRDVAEATAPGEAPARVENLVSQVDLAPTLLDYAGAGPCSGAGGNHGGSGNRGGGRDHGAGSDRGGGGCPPLDGRSLRPLLEGGEGWPADRAIPMMLDEGWTYRALRTESEAYLELDATRKAQFEPPEQELYDLAADPHELENLAGTPGEAERVAKLRARMNRLLGCAGIEGRDEPFRGAPFCE